MLKIISIISIGLSLVGCSSLQPYQRLYILAEKVEKKEVEMAAKCLPSTPLNHGLEEID